MPSSLIPEELLRAVASGGLKLLKTYAPSDAGAPGADVRRRSSFDNSVPEASAKLNTTSSLLNAILSLPLLSASHLPASCILHASPLTSHVLPTRVISARVGFDGATRVLSLQAHVNDTVVHAKGGSTAAKTALTARTAKSAPPPPALLQHMLSSLSFHVAISLPQFCCSLVGGIDKPEELMLLTLEGVSASLDSRRPYMSVDLRVQEVQVDNQLPGAAHAVVLGRAPPKRGTVIESEDGSTVLIRPFLQASIVHQSHHVTAAAPAAAGSRATDSHQRSAVVHVPYASALLQEMDVALEESLVRRILALLSSIKSAPGEGGGGEDDDGTSEPELFVIGGGGGIDGSVIARRGGARGHNAASIGINLAERRGRLGRGFAAARDQVAASILNRVTAANGRRRRASLGSTEASRFQQQLADLSHRAQVTAAKDLRKALRAQRVALRAVKRGAGALGSLISDQAQQLKVAAERTRAELASLRPDPSRSATATSAGISGPAVSRLPAPRLRDAAPSTGELAAVGRSRRTAALRQQQREAAALLVHTQSAAAGGSDAPLAAGWTSAAADSVSVLAADAQWWWPGRLPSADLRQRPAALQLFVEHLLINPLAVNVSFVRNATAAAAGAAGDAEGGGGALGTALRALGVMALSLNRAPVRLNGLELINVLAGSSDLSTRVAQHYVSAGLAEMYKVGAQVAGAATIAQRGTRPFPARPADRPLCRRPRKSCRSHRSAWLGRARLLRSGEQRRSQADVRPPAAADSA